MADSKPLAVPFKVYVQGCCFATKLSKNPLRDRRLYLKIDDFEVKLSDDHKTIFVTIKKHHIQKYKIHSCCVCLKERNKRVHADHQSKEGDLCKDHYAEKVRR